MEQVYLIYYALEPERDAHLAFLDEFAASEWVARENRLAGSGTLWYYEPCDLDTTTYPAPQLGDVSTH